MAKDEAKWAYWTKQIKEWQASGLSRNAYCKREGLKPTTFDYWRPLIVLSHAEANSVTQMVHGSEVTLIPIKVMALSNADDSVRDVPLEAMALGQPLKLKSPSGWELQLPVNVDTKWLIAVLRQLP